MKKLSKNNKIRLGIVGACGRGASFKRACDAIENVEIRAVCDINQKKLGDARERLGAGEEYSDFAGMLEKSELDAVIVGTPMPMHVPQAVAALERGLHVLCEVPAGISMDQCRELVVACEKHPGSYMMAENYIYRKPNVIVRELVRQGLFGVPYYAEGEYLHELKHMNEHETPWRRHWQTGIDGITYGTHSLGPILQWMPGDRVTRVCCEGTGVRHRDHTGAPYCQASSVMLCKTKNDALIKIRVDMLSDRPHATTNYQLQGVDGCYESARTKSEANRIWLRDRCPDAHTWINLEELAHEFLPELWREKMDQAGPSGHGGGDFFELLEFVNAIAGKRPMPMGIHEAMDMTLPGLVSQQSIAGGGRWIEVPDSREWVK